jgi:hypothetical protein
MAMRGIDSILERISGDDDFGRGHLDPILEMGHGPASACPFIL